MDKVKEIFAKALVWLKENKKIAIGAVVLVLVLVVGLSLFTGGPKRAVKGYIKGMNKLDADAVLKYYDAQGAIAWSACDEEPKDFEDAYDEVEDDDIESREESIEKSVDAFDNYDSFSVKVVEIKEVEKEEDCKGLYKVKAKIEIEMEDDDDETSSTETVTFMVYNNKVISGGI